MASSGWLTNWVCEGRLEAVCVLTLSEKHHRSKLTHPTPRRDDANDRFVSRNRPKPLSPLWEAYIDGYWRPWCQQFLATIQQRESGTSLFEKLSRDVRSHAFNLSNAEVNQIRADMFVIALSNARLYRHDLGNAGPPWWPQDGAAMLEAIKQERREIETLGYIRIAASRPSEGPLASSRVKGEEEMLDEQRA